MQKISEQLHSELWDSPFGKITVCCSEKGVRALQLGSSLKVRANGRVAASREERASGKAAKLARRAITELRQYASGSRKDFSVPLDLQGTPFQLKVWKALLRIPYGETRSYREIAREIGNQRASRAVGMANH